MKRTIDYSLVLSLAVLAISLIVFCGWLFDIPTFKSVMPDYITMKFNTALGFALSAAALIVLQSRVSKFVSNAATTVLSFTVFAIASATLFQYLSGQDLRIDEIFVRDPDGVGGRFPPGRLAPITSINFILIALSLSLSQRSDRRAVTASQLFAVTVLFASFQGLVGYAIGLTYLFGSAFYTQMAIHTALCFVLLATAQILRSSDAGFLANITRQTPTARLVRGLLLTVMFVPPLVQWIANRGLHAELYDADFVQLIQVLGTTAVMAMIIIVGGSALVEGESALSTERRNLLQSEEKFRALIEASAQIVWSATASGSVVEDSPSWRAFTGQSFDDWKGHGWINVLHPHDQGRAAHAWESATRAKDTYQIEYRIRHKSGEWRWTLARGTPLLNQDGTVRGWVGMNSDIHERKLIELDLKATKEDAERANDLKSAFLANMSHEIRTPLSAMIGFTELLQEESLNQAEQKNYIDIVARNGRQLEIIINDILDLSKVESGRLTFDYSPTNAVELAKETINVLAINARNKALTLSCEVDPTSPSIVTTDALRLKQILTNVVGNAVKFTNAGHVKIRILPWTKSNDVSGVSFEVEDTGIGILESQKDHVFEMFVQADGSMTRRFGGTGLGLSLSRRLARELGGDVSLKSTKPGIGTTFIIHIQDRPPAPIRPMLPPAPPDAQHALSKTAICLDGFRILVVDDAQDNQDLIQHRLTMMGATVTLASNGLEGYQAAINGAFDVVLMDLQMPVMDGYAATRRLRSEGFSKPVIALTAHAMAGAREKSLDAGCTDYLPKPIDFVALGRKIERYVKIVRKKRFEL